MVGTGSRAGPFRQWGMRLTSVRRRHRRRAERHVSGDRRRARVVVTANRAAAVARVVVLPQLLNVGLIGSGQQHVHAVVVVAVLRRAVDQALAQLLVGQPVEVICQRRRQLLLTDSALLKDQLLHRRQAVAEVGDTHLQAGDPVIFRAALLNAFRAFDAVVHQRRAENVVDVLFQHGINHVLDLDGFAGVVADLAVPRCHHLLEIVEVTGGERFLLRQEHFAAGGVAAAFQRGEHHAGEVDKAHAGATVAPLAAYRGFDAADGRVVVGIIALNAKLDKFRDHDFIVVKCRHPEAAADHLHAGVEEVVAHARMVAHAQVWLGRAQTAAGFQNRVGERVHRVHRLAVNQLLAADSNVLVQRAAGRGFGVRAGADFVHFQQLQPAAVQQLDGVLAVQALVQLHVAAVVRIEILVHTGERHGVAVGLNLQDQLNEVAQLQRLPEGFWRLVGNHVAVFRHRQQLVAAAFAGFRRRHLTRQVGEAFDVQADGFQHDINCLQELIAVQVFQHRQVDARAALVHFGAQAVETFLQHQREVYRQVGVAGGHVAFGFDDAGFQQAFLLVGEHAVAAVLHRLAAPPRADFMQHTLVLFAHREARTRTVRQIVNLFLNPGDGIFREDRRGAHFACLVADNQLVVLDPDGAFRQVMCQRQGATHRDRLVHVLLVHFGVMLRALGTDRRLDDMHQRHFMRFNTFAEGVEIQGGHRFILVRSRLTLSGRHTAARNPAGQGYPAVCQGQSKVGRAGGICSCPACDTAKNEYHRRRVRRRRSW